MNWCAVSFEPTIHFQILLANLREDFFLLRQVYTRKYWEHNYSFFDANEMDCCHEVIHIFHRPFGHLTFCFWTIPVCEKELRQYFFLLWYRKKRVGNEGCSVPHRDAKKNRSDSEKWNGSKGGRAFSFICCCCWRPRPDAIWCQRDCRRKVGASLNGRPLPAGAVASETLQRLSKIGTTRSSFALASFSSSSSSSFPSFFSWQIARRFFAGFCVFIAFLPIILVKVNWRE